MLKLLFIIFILLLLFYLLRPFFNVAFSVHKMQKQYSEMWRKVQEDAQRAAGDNGRYSQQRGNRNARRRKVFDSSEGEYVDFEEVAEERTIVVDNNKNDNDGYERVTDVKYEEIKD